MASDKGKLTEIRNTLVVTIKKEPTMRTATKVPATENATLPSVGFVRLPQVLAAYPVSRSVWLRGVKDGRFPKPVHLGPRTVAWRVEDIRSLIGTVSNGLFGNGGISGGITKPGSAKP
ncbi:helix-turn-helix transcriptional regulator [Pandoraea commovens]|uniref:helix-turn-helix transcriptional regulator n=1 Tax=Pandoraea commovens TaxID=2508289 RepID=UPI0031B5BDA6